MKHTLSNGMSVLFVPSHRSPVITLQAWIRFGSADESEDIAGLAHVFEHLLFKGTKKRPVGVIAREIESLGGDLNAYTTYDQTVMHMTLPRQHRTQGLDVLSDAIRNSVVEADEMARELQVILEEIKRRNDNPAAKSSDLLREKLFQGHTYARPVIGYSEVVAKLTRDVIMEQYHRYYNSKNIFLVIAGDAETREVLDDCERLFGSIGAGPTPATRPTLTKWTGVIENVATTPTPDAIMRLGWRIPNAVHDDTAALDAYALVLGQGESSRLVRRLMIEKPLVRHIGSDTWTPKDEGSFGISWMGPSGVGKNNPEILKHIWDCMYQPIEVSELDKAKRNLLASAIYSKESVDGLAQRFGFYEAVACDYRLDDHYMQLVQALTASELERVRDQYLGTQQMVFAGIYPENDQKPIWTIPIKTLKSQKKPVNASQTRPSPKDTTQDGNVKVFSYRGLPVVLKHDDSLPIFSLAWVGMGGVRLEPKTRPGLGNLWARSVTESGGGKKLPKMHKHDIDFEIDRLSAAYSAFHGRNSWGFEIEGMSQDFDLLVKIFACHYQEPQFLNREVNLNRQHMISDIQTSQDTPSSVARDLLLSNLYPNHAYGRPSRGTIAVLKKIKTNDLAKYHKKLTAQPQCLVVMGAVTKEQVLNTLNSYFPRLEKKKLSSELRTKSIPAIRSSQTLRQVLKKEQSHIFWGFRTCPVSHQDRWSLMALASVLSGQGGRLFKELRDVQSLCYSVSPSHTELLDGGHFGFYIATSPDKENQALKGLQQELDKIIGAGVSTDEWNNCRQFYVGNHLIGNQRYSQQVLGMALDHLYGFGYQHYFELEQELMRVRAADLQRVARKYFFNKPSITVVVGPTAIDKKISKASHAPMRHKQSVRAKSKSITTSASPKAPRR